MIPVGRILISIVHTDCGGTLKVMGYKTRHGITFHKVRCEICRVIIVADHTSRDSLTFLDKDG